MDIEVRFHGIEPSAALAAYARRHGSERLERFRRDIGSVVLRLADVNGPRGGADKRCVATVSGPGVGVCAIGATSGDFYSAVEMTLERIGDSLGRARRRVRDVRRRARRRLGRRARRNASVASEN